MQSVPLLWECVKSDSDLGLKVACASSLGKLQAVESTSDLLQILFIDQYPQSQREMGLALARLLGMEDQYIELSRKVSADLGTALAQEMENLRQGARSNFTDRDEASINLTDAREYFARGQVEDGLRSLLLVVDVPTSKSMRPACQEILSECGLRMREFGQRRLEYTILAIIALQKCGM